MVNFEEFKVLFLNQEVPSSYIYYWILYWRVIWAKNFFNPYWFQALNHTFKILKIREQIFATQKFFDEIFEFMIFTW